MGRLGIRGWSCRRFSTDHVKKRFDKLKSAEFNGVKGRFSLVEDEKILRHLFIDLGLPCDVDGLKSVGSKFSGLAKVLNRIHSVIYQRYAKYLSRILLSYCFGALHKPWKKDLAKNVIEVKAVDPQHMDMAEVQKRWPFLTLASLREEMLGNWAWFGYSEQRIEGEKVSCQTSGGPGFDSRPNRMACIFFFFWLVFFIVAII